MRLKSFCGYANNITTIFKVAAKVGLNTSKEAEEKIVAMIEEGSIHARISQKDGKTNYSVI